MKDQKPQVISTEGNKVVELAGCVIVDKEGRILLLHRNRPNRVQWELPGGKLEPGESAQETAIREVKEELGVDVDILGQLGADEFENKGNTLKYIWYRANIKKGDPKPVEDGFDQVKYFSWKQIKEMEDELSLNMKNLLRAYEDKKLKLELPQP